MTPTQLQSIKEEFEEWIKHRDAYWLLHTVNDEGETVKDGASIWQWFESKLQAVEEEVKQDLENHAIEVQLDTKQCSEIALMVYEKYLEWLKKPQFAIIPFNEWVKRNLKSNKLGGSEVQEAKFDEMQKYPVKLYKTLKRKSNKLKKDSCCHTHIGSESTLKFGVCTVCNKRIFK